MLRIFGIILFFLALPLRAQISASVKQGCGPLTVNFKDLTKSAASWSWDLGNGNTSKLPRPSAIYTAPGKYTISLMVVDSSGTIHNYTENNYIWVYAPPTVDFKVSKRKFCLGDTVTFYENCKAGDASITSYSWDAGEGVLFSGKNPVITYQYSGFKNIVLVATDKNGCSESKKLASHILVWALPDASFTADTAVSCRKPVKVTFAPSTTTGITSYKWDLGNGQTSSSQNPSAAYTKYGKYKVQLTLKDLNGCSNTLLQTAVSVDSVVLGFSASQDVVCDFKTEVDFLNLSNVSGSSYNWQWDLADGTKENTLNCKHTYKALGSYNIQLKLTGPNCQFSKKAGLVIKVTPKPKIDFVIHDTGACTVPYNIGFSGIGSIPLTFEWNFGKNSVPVKGNRVNYSFFRDDTVLVKMTALGSKGCMVDTSKKVYRQYVSTVIGGSPFGGCITYKPTYKFDSFFTTSPIVKTGWIFNNKKDSGDKITLTLPDTGIFTLKAIAVNDRGCSDTNVVNISAGIKIVPNIVFSKNRVCRNEKFKVYNKTTNAPVNTSILFNWKESSDILKDSLEISLKNTQGNIQATAITQHLGCNDTSKFTTVAVLAPRVTYSMTDFGFCTPAKEVTFINRTKDYTSFSWSLDPPPYFATNDTMKLSLAGVYQLKFKMKASNQFTGCADSFSTVMFISPVRAVARGNYTVIDSCLPVRIRLNDFGSMGKLTKWDLPSGDTTLAKDTIITLNQYGNYRFRRIAINNFDFAYCADTLDLYYNIYKPNIRNSISMDQNCTPAKLTLIDSGYFKARKASWLIGDSLITAKGPVSTLTLFQPTANNKVPAIFKGYDSAGSCFLYDTTSLVIGGPKAEIVGDFLYTCKLTRLQLSFKKTESFATKNVQWIVDDTFVSDKFNTEFAVYDTRNVKVKLKVTDSAGCSSVYTKTIFVRMYRPEIKFGTDIRVGLCPPSTVKFFDSSTAFNSPIQSWNWDFGDGTGSTQKNPSHTYYSPGYYTIKLQVKSFLGCYGDKTFTNYIKINGPQGKIIMSAAQGCTPMKVEYSSDAGNLGDIHWDFGDGEEGYGKQAHHVYKDSGTFRPSAILEDSAGCKLGITTTQKVKVALSPVAKIAQTTFCSNDSLRFADNSNYYHYPKNNVFSYDGVLIKGNTATFKPVAGKNLQFVAIGLNGCNDTLNLLPRISKVEPRMQIAVTKICRGDSVALTSLSLSDTVIKTFIWNVAGNLYAGSTIKIPALKAGKYEVKLKVENVLQCLDSLSQNNAFMVGDTVAPEPIAPVLISNAQNNEFKFMHRKSADFAFDNYGIWIKKASGVFQEINRSYTLNDTSVRLYVPGAWHSRLCFKALQTNFCKKAGLLANAKEHCSVLLNQQAKEDKVTLNWTRYAGETPTQYLLSRVNLNTSMTDWTKTFSSADTFYIDSVLKCKVPYRYKAEAVLPLAINSESNIRDTMLTNKGIPPTPFIKYVSVTGNNGLELVLDTLYKTLKGISQYDVYKATGSGSMGFWKSESANIVLNDHSIISAKNRYYYTVKATDECGTVSASSLASSPMLCRLHYDTLNPSNIVINWNKYAYWPAGVRDYTVQHSLDGINFNDVNNTTDSTYTFRSLNTCGGAGFYCRIKATSYKNNVFADTTPQISYSNIAGINFAPWVYIPTAFTPNNDGLNETFAPVCYWAKTYTLSIYNRWGEKLYEGMGCGNHWDGKALGMPAMNGVYSYNIKLTGYDNQRYYYTGVVNLLR